MTDASKFRPDESEVKERRPAFCPFCGHDGAFDGQGIFTDTVTVRRRGTETTIKRKNYRHRCSECNGHFEMTEDAWAVDE